ncbi:hypothetical protein RN001_015891, partial [Aquatica leii]
YRHRPLSLFELLEELENPDVIPGAPDSIVILPPLNANDTVTDEDSGDEDKIALNNLPGKNIPRTTSNNDLWDSEDELSLSSLVGDKRKRAEQSCISKTKK